MRFAQTISIVLLAAAIGIGIWHSRRIGRGPIDHTQAPDAAATLTPHVHSDLERRVRRVEAIVSAHRIAAEAERREAKR